MTYESAEVIREIPIPGNDDPESNPVEWLMVTRSDPGGGIPKFMVERGTPSSIVGDVSKFLNWATKKPWSELEDDGAEDAEVEKATASTDHAEGAHVEDGKAVANASAHGNHDAATQAKADANLHNQDADPSEGNLTAKAAGAAGTMGALAAGAASYLRSATWGKDTADDDAEDSDASSASSSSSGTFASALDEPSPATRHRHARTRSPDDATPRTSFAPERHSLGSDSNSSKTTLGAAKDSPLSPSHSSKELTRLAHKRQSIDLRAEKDRAAIEKKIAAANEKDAVAREKAIAKQERERVRQDERYQAELRKLDARRRKEEEKEAARIRKAEARDEMGRLRREVGEWKERAGVAEEEVKALREQVEALHGQLDGAGRGSMLKDGEKSNTT